MPTKISLVGGLLVINDSKSVRADGFSLDTDSVSKEVIIKDSIGSKVYKVKNTDANVAGVTSFATPEDLFLAIAALSSNSTPLPPTTPEV